MSHAAFAFRLALNFHSSFTNCFFPHSIHLNVVPVRVIDTKKQRISEVAGEGDGAIRETQQKSFSPPSDHKKRLQVVRQLVNTFINQPKVVIRR